jgi:hypothetical protein
MENSQSSSGVVVAIVAIVAILVVVALALNVFDLYPDNIPDNGLNVEINVPSQQDPQ